MQLLHFLSGNCCMLRNRYVGNAMGAGWVYMDLCRSALRIAPICVSIYLFIGSIVSTEFLHVTFDFRRVLH